MVKVTQSFAAFLFKKGMQDKLPLIIFGHTEYVTEELYNEYLEWVQTDEGKQYLEGGDKYNEWCRK